MGEQADPWGPPPRRRVTSLKAYVDAWTGLRIEEAKIYAHWEQNTGRPMYTDGMLNYIAGALDSSNNVQNLVNTSGEVTEASAATISSNTTNTKRFAAHGLPLNYDGGGTLVSAGETAATWEAVTPVQVAQAAGAVPDTSIVAATAAEKNDLILAMAFYTAGGGTFTLAIEEDHAASPTALDPDWGAVAITLPAGTTILGANSDLPFFHAVNSNVNKDIGFDGSACSFPANGDWVTVWGLNRTI